MARAAVGQGGLVMSGMTELLRAFSMAENAIGKDLRDGFRSVAEPVRSDAERNAVSRIPTVGVPWSRMRVGVTKTMVYVAPNQRGVKGRGNDRYRRPRFANLLRDRALDPALDANIEKITREAEDVLKDLARSWSRV